MIYAGLDIGNGYVKGLVKNTEKNHDAKAIAVDMPSASAIITNSNEIKITDETTVKRLMEDFWNEGEFSIDSNMISNKNSHTYIGKRAIKSGRSIQEFNLADSRHSKSENELSARLVLSILASKILMDYYTEKGKLPVEPITGEVTLALALPIAEFRDKQMIVTEEYKRQVHTVTIHNFDKPIVVNVKIANIKVAPEGASAHLAVISKGPAFMSKLIEDMESRGLKIPDGITSDDIVSAGNILGIDIGEGTVNYPVYNEFDFNADISMTLTKGYGVVLDEAATALSREGRPEGASRKILSEFLERNKDKPLKRAQYESAMAKVKPEVEIFANEIIDSFVSVIDKAGAFIEVIYVYGGGATAVKDVLYPKLISAIKNRFGADSFVPVLYLDSSYSRYLNRDGLFLLSSRNEKDAAKLKATEKQN